jgi:hypothetical protein
MKHHGCCKKDFLSARYKKETREKVVGQVPGGAVGEHGDSPDIRNLSAYVIELPSCDEDTTIEEDKVVFGMKYFT